MPDKRAAESLTGVSIAAACALTGVVVLVGELRKAGSISHDGAEHIRDALLLVIVDGPSQSKRMLGRTIQRMWDKHVPFH